ncbi:MAG: DM13 domain-containing protein [Candidatus Hodarchaeales archaeon]|jgi:hypothetical protein
MMKNILFPRKSFLLFVIVFIGFSFNTTSSLASDEVLLVGTLQQMDSAHWGKGNVSIINASSNLKLFFHNNVEINSGPDLYIYLSKNPSFSSINDDPGEYIDLGKLPQQNGPFNVSITGITTVSEYKSVVIWCLPFTVIFSFASLELQSIDSSNVPDSSSSQTSLSSNLKNTSSNIENTNPIPTTTNGFDWFLVLSPFLIICIFLKSRQ